MAQRELDVVLRDWEGSWWEIERGSFCDAGQLAIALHGDHLELGEEGRIILVAKLPEVPLGSFPAPGE